ncbi:ergothioneine biosynthesis glutamate--cysteine ligase EgtA [Streptomyces caniscabiei]|uniref:Glutamate--cysteine ligase EgtA n=1 Tax=Streptomyces caniscabiei TaxID=2746961 RepID=A0A927KYH9_9ACTN|nr:ergothioneine biosynthesis glutamate--cysteine ligase EgtA [Streptomyces caniscabiei]MBD9722425.1 ergothioneine biosynthesis glutamate--cysteine ligase EgtA [Streptomyces caniscabiei]MDX3514351.1 ergothioneine biosynthesis glutamate--cysteine ligase EgtA [Streptomyces caniscabiei]MDX3716623.1 ergothioneine biosynthesis glutamate--cysteine ligase EgtA [Streptomyces caniscabiei]MDX3731940.1 ergothioneine biosynthesis glutamate--cysteine ligase EgtA [Streptomyces caniscabiei]WEO22511.1 ergothi
MSDSTSGCTEHRSPVTEAEVEALVRGICFKTGPPRTLGVELEWHVHELRDPRLPATPARLEAAYAALRDLTLNSSLTVEPGGQLELSSAPAGSLMECVGSVSADLTAVRATLREAGLGISGHGHEPWHPPTRYLHEPRYDAMEIYLDRFGPEGRAMMCSSASVQVCLDAGYEEPGPLGHRRRWWLSHQLGAVLVAAFAHSPLARGEVTGWRSTRQALWAAMDPGRTDAPSLDGDPRTAWARLVLDAPVMCVRADEGPWGVPGAMTFREWTRSDTPPSRADLDYHMTTLFPPVRPRGHLEFRMIDAQPGEDGWIVPLAVTAALFEDPQAAETAYRTVKPLAERAGSRPAPRNPLWEAAARDGLADPELREAAVVCFAAAAEALPRLGASPEVLDAVVAYTDRHVARGRCPADDLLDLFHGKDIPA